MLMEWGTCQWLLHKLSGLLTGLDSIGVGFVQTCVKDDTTLHRDDSPAANPEGYPLNLSVEMARVGEGGGYVFRVETYITCREARTQ